MPTRPLPPYGSATSPSARPPTASGSTVLALTRDPVARDLLMEVALDRGYGLCCTAETAEALRTLEHEPPMLVVVDVDHADGRSLVRTLRGDERWRDIHMVGLTGTNNPMVSVTLDAPVFFKPDMTGLEEALAAYLGTHAAHMAGGVPPAPYLA